MLNDRATGVQTTNKTFNLPQLDFSSICYGKTILKHKITVQTSNIH